jgi:hypothetical protein
MKTARGFMAAETRLLAGCLAILGAWTASAGSPGTRDSGQSLAAELRAATPVEGHQSSGVLEYRKGQVRREVPFQARVEVMADQWRTIYETRPTAYIGAEKLVVIRSETGTNLYRYARAAEPALPLGELQALPPAEAWIPLAHSDFLLAELGLEFLHWPEQEELEPAMRRGQPCRVLESRHPDAPAYVRVVSWIDRESGGIVLAEAYDRRGKLVKVFEPDSIRKVQGEYRVESMMMRNVEAGSRTLLRFHLTGD